MYRRTSRQRFSKKPIFFGMNVDQLFWVAVLTLLGGLLLLGLWQLAVYPGYLCVSALLWQLAELKKKAYEEDPDTEGDSNPPPFAKWKTAESNASWFTLLGMLFLAAWTFSLPSSNDPVIKWTGVALIILMILAIAFSKHLGAFGDRLFEKLKQRKNRRKDLSRD